MIPARNVIDAHEQDVLVNDELLLLILKAFAQGTRSLKNAFQPARSIIVAAVE